jgi:hypothetical protein
MKRSIGGRALIVYRLLQMLAHFQNNKGPLESKALR